MSGNGASGLESMIGRFFQICARNYRQEIYPEFVTVWLAHLNDIPAERLQYAFSEALRTCKFMPNIAEIRAFCVVSEEKREEFEAEQAWESLQQILRRHWFGELLPIISAHVPEGYGGRVEKHGGGYMLFPLPFDAATDYAIRQCGDLERLASIPPDKFDFVRKDFLSHFKRHRETAGLLGPGREEAKRIIEGLRQGKLPEPNGGE